MPGKDLPLSQDSLVSGMGYASFPVPDDDASSLAGTDQQEVLGAPNSMPAPVQPVSLATKTMDAPPLGAFLTTNLHDKNYLDPTKPNISPESQEG